MAVTGLTTPTPAASTQGNAHTNRDGGRDGRRAEARLRAAVERHVHDAGLKRTLEDYRLDSSVVQLRRYIENNKRKLVCVVDVSLSDREGALFASVRGNATSQGASEDETLDAAAYSAVSRLPQALRAAKSQF